MQVAIFFRIATPLMSLTAVSAGSFGYDPVSRDNVMPLARTVDAHIKTEEMLLFAERQETPLTAVGHAQDELASVLHKPSFQCYWAVAGHSRSRCLELFAGAALRISF